MDLLARLTNWEPVTPRIGNLESYLGPAFLICLIAWLLILLKVNHFRFPLSDWTPLLAELAPFSIQIWDMHFLTF
jgi:hypothetical protein